jgi:hypothetical protein
VVDLEEILRNAIVYGQPITHRPFKKILIVLEGNIEPTGGLTPGATFVPVPPLFGVHQYPPIIYL